MTKDLEKWIRKNNPMKELVDIQDINICDAWNNGAIQMARYLQSQPPTKEQLVKALRLLADFGGYVGYTDEKNAEVIIKHWNNE